MRRECFDRDWTFRQFEGLGPLWFEPADPERAVHLPHDFSVLQPRQADCLSAAWGGYFKGGYGLYKKTLFAPENWRGGKVVLDFDGVYMNSEVYVNDNFVVRNPYGYTAFHADLTPYLNIGGENKITVLVNAAAQPNSRWYAGAGIYRHVKLLISGAARIEPWGVAVVTDSIDEKKAALTAKVSIVNEDERAAYTLRNRVIDPAGNEVCKVETMETLSRGEGRAIVQQMAVGGAKLWSPESPSLYRLVSELIKNGEIVDTEETVFGVRTVAFEVQRGFLLNGTPVKMKGGCVHHDLGFLGAASFDAAEERRVKLLLDSGFNAIRCAHNPPSTAFLDACDRLGMLVIDEIFDCWREGKSMNDYHVYFADWWEKDIRSMVLRDRNHPSVVLWSTGNEIQERDGRSEGAVWSKRLAELVTALDSSRGVTNALCDLFDPSKTGEDPFADLTEQFAAPLTVAGYNYLYERYEKDHERFPNRLMCGTETFAKAAQPTWEATERNSYVIGDFVWTSMDYLGEAGIGHVWRDGEEGALGQYPWNRAWCGDIDLLGMKRPQSYFRDCVWGRDEKPSIFVSPPDLKHKTAVLSRWSWPDVEENWTWPGYENEIVDIEVYSGCERIELRLNGKVIGEQEAGRDAGYIARFAVPYAAGTLEAVGYRDGAEVSRNALYTAGAPAALRLCPDRGAMKSGGQDLCFVRVEVVDERGTVVPRAAERLAIEVTGCAALQAVGNGDFVSEQPFYGSVIDAWRGYALFILRSSDEAGEAKAVVTAGGMMEEVTIICE